ncbi:MAG: hypothetical protein J6112_02795 [Clostridia bacterium]|nr:hypothetical protein [Clostridia bacterium]
MEILLARLKIDLGIINSTIYDARLLSLLEVAKKEIEKEGATLDLEDISDSELVIDYARYLWQSRREPMTEPRSLRWRINNRIFGGNGNA